LQNIKGETPRDRFLTFIKRVFPELEFLIRSSPNKEELRSLINKLWGFYAHPEKFLIAARNERIRLARKYVILNKDFGEWLEKKNGNEISTDLFTKPWLSKTEKLIHTKALLESLKDAEEAVYRISIFGIQVHRYIMSSSRQDYTEAFNIWKKAGMLTKAMKAVDLFSNSKKSLKAKALLSRFISRDGPTVQKRKIIWKVHHVKRRIKNYDNYQSILRTFQTAERKKAYNIFKPLYRIRDTSQINLPEITTIMQVGGIYGGSGPEQHQLDSVFSLPPPPPSVEEDKQDSRTLQTDSKALSLYNENYISMKAQSIGQSAFPVPQPPPINQSHAPPVSPNIQLQQIALSQYQQQPLASNIPVTLTNSPASPYSANSQQQTSKQKALEMVRMKYTEIQKIHPEILKLREEIFKRQSAMVYHGVGLGNLDGNYRQLDKKLTEFTIPDITELEKTLTGMADNHAVPILGAEFNKYEKVKQDVEMLHSNFNNLLFLTNKVILEDCVPSSQDLTKQALLKRTTLTLWKNKKEDVVEIAKKRRDQINKRIKLHSRHKRSLRAMKKKYNPNKVIGGLEKTRNNLAVHYHKVETNYANWKNYYTPQAFLQLFVIIYDLKETCDEALDEHKLGTSWKLITGLGVIGVLSLGALGLYANYMDILGSDDMGKNQPPKWIGTDPHHVQQGSGIYKIDLGPLASDPEGEPLLYNVTDDDGSDVWIDGGMLCINTNNTEAAPRPYNIKIRIKDNQGEYDDGIVKVDLENEKASITGVSFEQAGLNELFNKIMVLKGVFEDTQGIEEIGLELPNGSYVKLVNGNSSLQLDLLKDPVSILFPEDSAPADRIDRLLIKDRYGDVTEGEVKSIIDDTPSQVNVTKVKWDHYNTTTDGGRISIEVNTDDLDTELEYKTLTLQLKNKEGNVEGMPMNVDLAKGERTIDYVWSKTDGLTPGEKTLEVLCDEIVFNETDGIRVWGHGPELDVGDLEHRVTHDIETQGLYRADINVNVFNEEGQITILRAYLDGDEANATTINSTGGMVLFSYKMGVGRHLVTVEGHGPDNENPNVPVAKKYITYEVFDGNNPVRLKQGVRLSDFVGFAPLTQGHIRVVDLDLNDLFEDLDEGDVIEFVKANMSGKGDVFYYSEAKQLKIIPNELHDDAEIRIYVRDMNNDDYREGRGQNVTDFVQLPVVAAPEVVVQDAYVVYGDNDDKTLMYEFMFTYDGEFAERANLVFKDENGAQIPGTEFNDSVLKEGNNYKVVGEVEVPEGFDGIADLECKLEGIDEVLSTGQNAFANLPAAQFTEHDYSLLSDDVINIMNNDLTWHNRLINRADDFEAFLETVQNIVNMKSNYEYVTPRTYEMVLAVHYAVNEVLPIEKRINYTDDLVVFIPVEYRDTNTHLGRTTLLVYRDADRDDIYEEEYILDIYVGLKPKSVFYPGGQFNIDEERAYLVGEELQTAMKRTVLGLGSVNELLREPTRLPAQVVSDYWNLNFEEAGMKHLCEIINGTNTAFTKETYNILLNQVTGRIKNAYSGDESLFDHNDRLNIDYVSNKGRVFDPPEQ